eukprot:TRINITY_DN21861_c0_g1_i2.p1 TRINITY_DN21861_c0_g1~~TRINITY_DN21861_c0_g1_i2.p1  ORF type:complete len:337 (-),score=93.98 TRINITY_DN21861_c0_g1_i2:107-1117(-)
MDHIDLHDHDEAMLSAQFGGEFGQPHAAYRPGHTARLHGRDVTMPSAFILSKIGEMTGLGKTGAASGMAGAGAGALMYAHCKSKCPGAPKGFLRNLPMLGGGIGFLMDKFGGGSKGGGGGDGGAEEDQSNQEIDNQNEESPEEITEKDNEFEKAENAACRLNCKIQSLMAAAAAAGAVGLGMSYKNAQKAAMPLDEQLAAPALALLGAAKSQHGGASSSSSSRQRKSAMFMEVDESASAAQDFNNVQQTAPWSRASQPGRATRSGDYAVSCQAAGMFLTSAADEDRRSAEDMLSTTDEDGAVHSGADSSASDEDAAAGSSGGGGDDGRCRRQSRRS